MPDLRLDPTFTVSPFLYSPPPAIILPDLKQHERLVEWHAQGRASGRMSTRVPQSWCGCTADEAGHGIKFKNLSIAPGDWNGRSHGE